MQGARESFLEEVTVKLRVKDDLDLVSQTLTSVGPCDQVFGHVACSGWADPRYPPPRKAPPLASYYGLLVGTVSWPIIGPGSTS